MVGVVRVDGVVGLVGVVEVVGVDPWMGWFDDYDINKRRGIGQYPIFSRTPYFSVKKHATFVLKVEV